MPLANQKQTANVRTCKVVACDPCRDLRFKRDCERVNPVMLLAGGGRRCEREG